MKVKNNKKNIILLNLLKYGLTLSRKDTMLKVK